MSHRIIATQNRTVFAADGVTVIVKLSEENEVITNDESLKELLLSWGWAKLYDDTKPYPPRGFGIYELGMVYEGGRFIINGNALYKSKLNLVNGTTSNTFILAEWDLILQGV